jgi:hypothetical protein
LVDGKWNEMRGTPAAGLPLGDYIAGRNFPERRDATVSIAVLDQALSAHSCPTSSV